MTFVRAGTRRVTNLVRLTRTVVTSASREIVDGYSAWREEQLGLHLPQRGEAAVQTVKNGYLEARDLTSAIAQTFRDNPKDAGVQLFTVVMTSIVVSGGPDGDGGAPDLDLMLGIDAHRSILSHSILMGTVLETGILSLLLMVKMVHDKLPVHHDPLWDDIHGHSQSIALSANLGPASAWPITCWSMDWCNRPLTTTCPWRCLWRHTNPYLLSMPQGKSLMCATSQAAHPVSTDMGTRTGQLSTEV